MKRIDRNNLDKGFPATTNHLQFLDDELHDNIINLCNAIYGENQKIILSGCMTSIVNNNTSIVCSAGYVLINGEIYKIDQTSSIAAGGHGFKINETVTSEIYDDGNQYPAYKDRKCSFISGVMEQIDNFYSYSQFKRFEFKTSTITPTQITGININECVVIAQGISSVINYDAIANLQSTIDLSAVWSINTKFTLGRIGVALVRAGEFQKYINVYSDGTRVYFIINDQSGSTQFSNAATIQQIINYVHGQTYPADGLVRVSFSIIKNN